jgi:hypothetical protein
MNREKIIELARLAGFHIVIDDLPGGQVRRSVKSVNTYCTDEIAHFAAMVVAEEREECAKACDSVGRHPPMDDWSSGYRGGGLDCAATIRARNRV